MNPEIALKLLDCMEQDFGAMYDNIFNGFKDGEPYDVYDSDNYDAFLNAIHDIRNVLETLIEKE